MTWTKLSDNYVDRLEDLELTPAACWLHTAALVYCNRVGNDGKLPRARLPKVADIEAADFAVAELEQQGLWVSTPGGWQIDWRDQELAADVEKRREGTAERQRRKRQHDAGDHSLCSPDRPCTRSSPTRDVTRDITRRSHRESRPPVPPVPTRRSRDGAGQRCEHNLPYAADGTVGCADCPDQPASTTTRSA